MHLETLRGMGCSLAHPDKVILLEALGFGTEAFVLSPRAIQKYLRDSLEESLGHDWNRVLKFSQMFLSF